jgi:hypothetical protein
MSLLASSVDEKLLFRCAEGLCFVFHRYMDFSRLESECKEVAYVYDSPWSGNVSCGFLFYVLVVSLGFLIAFAPFSTSQSEAILCEVIYSIINWM